MNGRKDLNRNLLFSIIIPVYNNAEETRRCLHSLQENELREQSEIIVIDDCSPDAGEAIKQAAQEYNARYYRQPVNNGPGIARNRGSEEAKGDILVFIDSDCIAPKDWLSKITAPIRDGKCYATISCYSGAITPNWITVFQDEDYRYRMPKVECDTSFLNSCNFAIKRTVFLDCGGFPNQRISEDMVLGLLLAENSTPARFLPDAGVLHGYYSNLGSYLKQRFSFAYNTVSSYAKRANVRTKKANANARSFNPLRTASSMLFTSISILMLFFGLAAAISGIENASGFLIFGLASLVMVLLVNGRFLTFSVKRQGLVRSISYFFLLYLIDIAYICGVLKGLTSFKMSKNT